MIGLRGGISIAIAVVLCIALGVIAWGARQAAERTIVPEIIAKADSVGRSAAALIERANQAGVPMDRLVGVAAYFDELRKDNAEFARITLVSNTGALLAQSGFAEVAADAPVARSAVTSRSGAPLATIAIAIDPSVISQQVGAVLIDVAFIGVVSLLVALELVALVIGTRGVAALAAVEMRLRALSKGILSRHEDGRATAAQPLVDPIDAHIADLEQRHMEARALAERRGDAAAVEALDDIAERSGIGLTRAGEGHTATIVRPALFLFMMAEELTRPFLPRYVQAIAPSDGRFSLDVAVSLPIVAFMAVVALCQIPFASLSERLGRRSGFLIGALLAATGYALSAAAPDYMVFLGSRIATAFGYALVFVSAQGHVVDHSQGGARTSALAVFVRAIMVASLCGPPIGGVIADRLGGAAGFYVAGGIALIALVVAALTLPGGERPGHGRAVSLSDLKAAARAPRLMALLAGCAFPAKFLFAALCFYLVPVELQKQGYSSAAVGRFQMIYPVMMVLAVPFFAALADRFNARTAFVAVGGIVAGLGALAVPLNPVPAVIAVALLLLGLGQSMSIASQSALVADTASAMPGGKSAGVLGLFRLVERSGNAAGPACAGFLLGAVGFGLATASLGAVVVAGALVFALSGRGVSATGKHGRSASASVQEGSPV